MTNGRSRAKSWHKAIASMLGRFLCRIGILGIGATLACLVLPLDGGGAVHAAQPSRETQITRFLRVCADPNNLPFSNNKEEGFENKITKLIADELERPIRYTWWPQTIGFVRNTLRLRRCDLVAGIATVNETVQNTNPYYRSVYTMVYRSNSGLKATTLSDPAIKNTRIGVIAGTPPATLMVFYDLMDNMTSYHRTVDTRFFSPSNQAISDVAEGKIDIALVWGPVAGYFVKQQNVPLTVVPLLNEKKGVRLDFRVSMAVRFREPEWKRLINRTLRRLQPKINEILKSYAIPLLDERGRLITD